MRLASGRTWAGVLRRCTGCYAPPYSPELNDIKSVFGVLKGHELPERSYSTLDELLAAVRRALRRYHLRVRRR
nr:transposase [Corallococcus carmarthensis]